MKVKEAISKLKKDVSSKLPNTDSSIIEILSSVLDLNETGVINCINNELTLKQQKQLGKIIARLLNDEPLEYITGLSSFYGHRFQVTPDTLIPRIETEMLVSLAYEVIYENFYAFEREDLSVIDIGTGSGCIIISLAESIKEKVNFYATDISDKALEVATENIKAYDLSDTITLQKSNLLYDIPKTTKFDLIIANLPYISSSDVEHLPDSVKEFEPLNALEGGEDGTKLINDLLEQSKENLNKNATILLEAQPQIMKKISVNAAKLYPDADIRIINDIFDKKRFLAIKNINPTN